MIPCIMSPHKTKVLYSPVVSHLLRLCLTLRALLDRMNRRFNEWNGPWWGWQKPPALYRFGIITMIMISGSSGGGVQVTSRWMTFQFRNRSTHWQHEKKNHTISSDPHLWHTIRNTKFRAYMSHLELYLLFLGQKTRRRLLSLITCNRLRADRYGHLADEYQLNLWRPLSL